MFCSAKCALRADAKNVTAVTASQGFGDGLVFAASQA
jgi:hypothetical protein